MVSTPTRATTANIHIRIVGVVCEAVASPLQFLKRLIYEWTDELREAVALAKSARPVEIAPGLFCNRRGECYFNQDSGRAGGWDTMWRNLMDRVRKETKVREHFTEHDMRAKCASDADTLEHAQALLARADGKVTQRIYRRKPERMKPLR